MKAIEITDEEYDKIIEEMSERIKDVAYMNSEISVRNQSSKENMQNTINDRNFENLEIDFTIKILANDLRQILGRVRRVKETTNMTNKGKFKGGIKNGRKEVKTG